MHICYDDDDDDDDDDDIDSRVDGTEHLETINRTLSHKGLSPTHAYVYTYMYCIRIYV